MPVEKPAEWMREPDALTAASTIHVAARPAYNGQRARSAFFIESKTNTRSYSITITGAVTIDSLHAIPSAQATIAAACHEVRPDRDRAHARVHRQQVEQRHHRLGSLRHVVDDLGVQRMQRPDERDGKRDVDRVRLKPDTRTATSYETEPRELERATHQPEQDHGAQQMDGEVRDVVAADAHAAERVVDRERHVDDRPAGGRHFALRK